MSLVRPHLESASTVWNPHLRGDIEVLERVQRRATRIPTDLSRRLKIWGLSTLKERRTRGDLIEMFKIRNKMVTVNWFTGPRPAPETQTRSALVNSFRLEREVFPPRVCNDFARHVSVRHKFFLNRVTSEWNRLSNVKIGSPSQNVFKARIDNHRKRLL